MYTNIVIFGSSGSIGNALLVNLNRLYSEAKITAFTKKIPDNVYKNVTFNEIDYNSEPSIANAALVSKRTNLLIYRSL